MPSTTPNAVLAITTAIAPQSHVRQRSRIALPATCPKSTSPTVISSSPIIGSVSCDPVLRTLVDSPSLRRLLHRLRNVRNAASFLDHDNPVHRDAVQILHQSARPANLQSVDLSVLPDPEMHTRIVARQVTFARPHRAVLHQLTRFHLQPRPDSIAIAPASNRLDRHPMMRCRRHILEHDGCRTHVAIYDV